MNNNNPGISSATLAGIEIFSGLSSDERKEIATSCRGHLYQSDELILSHQDNSSDVFFVVSGLVRVTVYSSSGKEITFRDVPAGQMFGELSAIDARPRSAHVIALTASSLIFVTADGFWEILRTYPDVTQKTFKYLTRLVRLLSDRVVEFRTLGVKNRIHAELLRLGRDVEDDKGNAAIIPAPTHSEIANRVSTHREAVTREMGALSRQGIVRKKGNSLVIQDIDRLKKMVHETLNEPKE